MAFPNLSHQDWVLSYFGSADSVSLGEGFSLSVGAGAATIVNPYDHRFKFVGEQVPNSSAIINTADRNQVGVPMIITGQLYSDDADPSRLFDDLYGADLLMDKLEKLTKLEHNYIRLRLWDGAALQGYRKYIQVTGITQPAVRKTHLRALHPYQLHCEVVDPHWYEETVQTETIAVVDPGQPKVHAFTTEGVLYDTKRVFIEILKDGAGNPSNVSIGDANGKTLFAIGTLTLANERWMIDCFVGAMRRGTGTQWASNSDQMDQMTGDFLTVDASAETYTISDATPTSFQVKASYLRRIV